MSIFEKKRPGNLFVTKYARLFLVLIIGMVKLVQIWFVTSLQPVTNVKKKLIHEKVP